MQGNQGIAVMVWTRKGKTDFYWARRRQADKLYAGYAETLGTSVKRAKAKARKDVSHAYQQRKEGFAQVNRYDKQINRINSKENLTKSETRKLEILLAKKQNLAVKTQEK